MSQRANSQLRARQSRLIAGTDLASVTIEPHEFITYEPWLHFEIEQQLASVTLRRYDNLSTVTVLPGSLEPSPRPLAERGRTKFSSSLPTETLGTCVRPYVSID